MKHRRFQVRPGNIRGREAVIDDPGEVRHVSKVLRLGAGDSVILFDGEGKEYNASIRRVSRGKISLVLDPRVSATGAESPLRITLGAAVLKSSKFDWLLQKASELGVSEIAPFYSSRAVPRREEGKTRSRQSRWEKILSEAARQCGRTIVPTLRPALSLEKLLEEDWGTSSKFFLWEEEKTQTLGKVLEGTPPSIFVLVGPEGGFSEEEASRAQEAGFRPVRLGPRILRAETAGIAVIALLQFLRGDLNQ